MTLARLNLSRSLCAAALVMLSSGGALFATGLPAAASVPILVTISDAGFSQREIDAQVGDVLTFQLDSTSSRRHTVTLLIDGGQVEVDFSQQPENSWTLPPFKNSGKATFYDRYNMRRPDRHAFIGTIQVADAPEPDPPSTTTSSTSTTVTTAPASSTTTTIPPSTTTTAPSSIRPFLIPDPQPTSTTTTAPHPAAPQNGEPTTPPADKGKEKAKDSGKSRAAGAETPATAPPADPNAVPPDSLFDPASLTPGPTALPDIFGSDSGEEAAIAAAALADLLDPASVETDGGDGRLTVYGLGALALVLLVGGVWAWQHRSSRYIPA